MKGTKHDRWQFTSLLGNCAMFLRGSAHIRTNPYSTPEINAQHDRACLEVEKLSRMLKERFK